MSLLPSIAVVEHVALQGLLYSLFFMFSIPVLAAAIGIVFLAVMFVTFAFSFFGIDLWKSVEKLFDQLKQDRLATAANSIAKMASSDAEKTKQLAFLAKKNSLLYEGRILAQRDVYQAEEIEHLQKSHSPKSKRKRHANIDRAAARSVVVVARGIELSLKSNEKDPIFISTLIARRSAHAAFAETCAYLVVSLMVM
ncbi:hypothetical protein N7476_004823 [Penicillium atrosanguineum]|uniref:Uncharacterized protein n=1 Tax=Penicillium atrosanguineum TaxID=1132637 RepID=A0A9W9U516_9EURO|nr:hypothetical protein N7526_001882 [Penicillium atrosanguineum]KAJ5318403.1 hypothetical protein N7476_004823 [Penicillium atrosanguineum]